MRLSRSTFYDTPSVPLGLDELVVRIGAICDEFECYGDATLAGEVEVDGAAFGGHVRPRTQGRTASIAASSGTGAASAAWLSLCASAVGAS